MIILSELEISSREELSTLYPKGEDTSIWKMPIGIKEKVCAKMKEYHWLKKTTC